MPAKKLSPKRETKKETINYESSVKAGKYGTMGLYSLIVIGAVVSFVLFVIYATKAHGEGKVDDGTILDPYEHDFGRMTISAYATMIGILAAILMLMFYVTYLAHTHLRH